MDRPLRSDPAGFSAFRWCMLVLSVWGALLTPSGSEEGTLDYRFMAELVESLLLFFRDHR